MSSFKRIEFVDSHTAGEPTRVVIAGGPDLGSSSMIQRRFLLQSQFDDLRRTVVLEPRGSDALVGALLCEPTDASCAAGVIFFNNTGYLGMCGHGTIGVAVTLAHLGKISLGTFGMETPVGVVNVDMPSPNRAAFQNVPAYRYRKQLEISVPNVGLLRGDVAWGGNWFFLVEQSPHSLTAENIDRLSDAARRTRGALQSQGVTGVDGAPIDHIEFFGPPFSAGADSRNFVMCPGGAYDRSPCGTGTSAKLACLAADGRLQPGEPWVQEGILGTRFTGSYQPLANGQVAPTIEGNAFVTAEGRMIAQAEDPFQHGITAEVAL